MTTTIIERHGLRFHVSWQHDPDMGAPWKEHEGHGAVSGMTTRSKRPGELVLTESNFGRRYYDTLESTRIAKRDGWGLNEPCRLELAEKLGRVPTQKEVTQEAVARDYQRLRDWCMGKGWWEVVTVTLLDAEGRGTPLYDSMGGIESDASEAYRSDVVEDLIGQILHGRGDPDKLERITVGAVTYELREGGPTLTDKLAAALRAVLPYAETEVSSIYEVARRDGDDVAEEEAEIADRELAQAQAAIAEYDATKGGA